MQVSERHVNYLAIVGVRLFFRPQQFQLKTKEKLFERLTIQNNCEVTGSVRITTQKAKREWRQIKSVKYSEQRDYLNRIEMKKTNQ